MTMWVRHAVPHDDGGVRHAVPHDEGMPHDLWGWIDMDVPRTSDGSLFLMCVLH